MNCNICTEKYNKSNRSKISCSACLAETCSECTERYLLMTIDNAHCMSCRAAWTREILDTCGLSKKFVTKDYKKRREDLLFERERAMMPATQPIVEKEIIIRRLAKEAHELEVQVGIGKDKYFQDCNIPLQNIADMIHSESTTECIIARIELARANILPYELLNAQLNTKRTQISALNSAHIDTKREARKFIRACSYNGCQGFLSTSWKCGLCEKRTCPDCHEPKEAVHVCKQECIDTANLLNRDTKTCPKCATLIFKIEGCDQMWCTQCATAFSWRTGQIEIGRIHNPHYYDYQRNNGRIQREIGDIPCGGMPISDALLQTVKNYYPYPRNQSIIYLRIIRMHHHIQEVMMHTWIPRWTDNQDLRVSFMLKDITEDIFKKKIQQREKENQKRTEIGHIMKTYQVITSEIMQRLVSSSSLEEFEEISKEFDIIREYINTISGKISKRYGCVSPYINDQYAIMNIHIK